MTPSPLRGDRGQKSVRMSLLVTNGLIRKPTFDPVPPQGDRGQKSVRMSLLVSQTANQNDELKPRSQTAAKTKTTKRQKRQTKATSSNGKPKRRSKTTTNLNHELKPNLKRPTKTTSSNDSSKGNQNDELKRRSQTAVFENSGFGSPFLKNP